MSDVPFEVGSVLLLSDTKSLFCTSSEVLSVVLSSTPLGILLPSEKAWPAVDQLISSISTLMLTRQGSFIPISLFPRRFGSCALLSVV
jgi:hypothetical protein